MPGIRARPRRGAFGLRGRIVGAVVVTTVATLAVAAIALLGPLENSLRHAALTTLQRDVKGQIVGFKELDLDLLPVSSSTSRDARLKKETQVRDRGAAGRNLARQEARRQRHAARLPGCQRARFPSGRAPRRCERTGRRVRRRDGRVPHRQGQIQLRHDRRRRQCPCRAIPIKKGFVLVVRRPIDEIPSAVHAVRTAFLTAALAGLALTLILAIPLAGRIVARLRRPARGGTADGPGGAVCRGRGRPGARRGRRPGADVRAHAAAARSSRKRRAGRSWRPPRTSCAPR